MNGKIFEYDKDMKDYVHNLDNDGWVSETILYKIMDSHFIKELINTEIEILEDNTEEIEELELIGTNFMDMDKNQLKDEINKNRIFINKLRQEVFESRKEKE